MSTPATFPNVTEEHRALTWHHIPSLRELLPKTGGIPGVTYLQCAVTNLRRAQDEGWGKMVGGSLVYTIVGPEGEVDCELYCKGQPITGQPSSSGARRCEVDLMIEEATGLQIQPRLKAREEEPPKPSKREAPVAKPSPKKASK